MQVNTVAKKSLIWFYKNFKRRTLTAVFKMKTNMAYGVLLKCTFFEYFKYSCTIFLSLSSEMVLNLIFVLRVKVSSAFLDINRPVSGLMTAARKGRRPEESAARLREQTETLTAIAAAVHQLFPRQLTAGEGSLAQLAAKQLGALSGQVVNAATVLAEVPKSKAAAENATLFQV
jgi:hypothetical protein